MKFKHFALGDCSEISHNPRPIRARVSLYSAEKQYETATTVLFQSDVHLSLQVS